MKRPQEIEKKQHHDFLKRFYLFIYLFIYSFIYREIGRERERVREKQQYVVASHVPRHRGPGPQPRHVP